MSCTWGRDSGAGDEEGKREAQEYRWKRWLAEGEARRTDPGRAGQHHRQPELPGADFGPAKTFLDTLVEFWRERLNAHRPVRAFRMSGRSVVILEAELASLLRYDGRAADYLGGCGLVIDDAMPDRYFEYCGYGHGWREP